MAEEPIARDNRGSIEGGAHRQSIDAQLQVLTAAVRGLGRDVLEGGAQAGLVVGDHDTVVTDPVDAVDIAGECQAAAVGEGVQVRVGAVASEGPLGGKRNATVCRTVAIVPTEKLVEHSPQALRFRLPEDRSSGQAALLGEGELVVAEAVEALVMCGAPSLIRGRHVVGLEGLVD